MYRIVQRKRALGPSDNEMRLHRKALLYWRSIKGGRPYVPFHEFDPVYLHDRSTSGFLLDIYDAHAVIIRHIGNVLREEAGLDRDNIPLSEIPSGSLLSHFARSYSLVVQYAEPLSEEVELMIDGDQRTLYRGILLPLCAGGSKIDHVYGIISWKNVASEAGLPDSARDQAS